MRYRLVNQSRNIFLNITLCKQRNVKPGTVIQITLAPRSQTDFEDVKKS